MELAEGLGVGLGPSDGVVVWWCGGVVEYLENSKYMAYPRTP